MLAVCVTFSMRSGMLDAFAAGAGSSDMFKIESSQLALEKVSGEGVRAFAEQMVEDYTATGEKMKAAAQEDGNRRRPE